MEKELKSLKVFSKKLDKVIDIFNDNNLTACSVENAWANNGWNNFLGDSWLNNGWNNFLGDSWRNNGWNNFLGDSWLNNGWNNFLGDSWMDKGWNNFINTWTNNTGNDGSSSEGCFITTAAVEHKGLADDCEELTLLRKYRDILVKEDPKFKEIVLEYYKIAPQIVSKISDNKNKEQILENIYDELVVPVTSYLKNGQIEEAKNHYISIYNKLKEEYI